MSKSIQKYVIFAVAVSFVLHGLFFSVFNVKTKNDQNLFNLGLSIISIEQLEYLKSTGRKLKNTIMAIFPKSVAAKQPLWADAIDIIGEDIVTKIDVNIDDNLFLQEDSKIYNFRDIQIPLAQKEYILQDYYPSMDYAGQHETLSTSKGEEDSIIVLGNGLKIRYYVQGPVSIRDLYTYGPLKEKTFIDKHGLCAKLRLWVTKDGRINQVIIEEGTSFSLIDLEIVKMIKSWHFTPSYSIDTSNYDWGVIVIRIQR
jgi:hypothetical protein